VIALSAVVGHSSPAIVDRAASTAIARRESGSFTPLGDRARRRHAVWGRDQLLDCAAQISRSRRAARFAIT
jgi:hypothetical protein